MNFFQIKDSGNQLPKLLRKFFSYLMICFYMGFGLFVLIKGWYALSKTQSTGIGILLIAYSLFRLYRVVRESGQKKSSDELSDNKENE
jgi:Kef-type K+ transport system membrane component KefB